MAVNPGASSRSEGDDMLIVCWTKLSQQRKGQKRDEGISDQNASVVKAAASRRQCGSPKLAQSAQVSGASICLYYCGRVLRIAEHLFHQTFSSSRYLMSEGRKCSTEQNLPLLLQT